MSKNLIITNYHSIMQTKKAENFLSLAIEILPLLLKMVGINKIN